MSELIGEFTYKLSRPFRYTSKGELVDRAGFLTVKAPTNKNLRDVSIIEQEYNQALLKAASTFSDIADKFKDDENKNKKDDKKSTPTDDAQSVVMLMQSGGADMNKCYEALQRILVSGATDDPTCTIDDVHERFTSSLFDVMSPIDTKIILGMYIQNFFNMGV